MCVCVCVFYGAKSSSRADQLGSVVVVQFPCLLGGSLVMCESVSV